MGGCEPSATVTSKFLSRAAIASAKPAGPPPIMKTSVVLAVKSDKAVKPKDSYCLFSFDVHYARFDAALILSVIF
jgi:hypothetical protein